MKAQKPCVIQSNPILAPVRFLLPVFGILHSNSRKPLVILGKVLAVIFTCGFFTVNLFNFIMFYLTAGDIATITEKLMTTVGGLMAMYRMYILMNRHSHIKNVYHLLNDMLQDINLSKVQHSIVFKYRRHLIEYVIYTIIVMLIMSIFYVLYNNIYQNESSFTEYVNKFDWPFNLVVITLEFTLYFMFPICTNSYEITVICILAVMACYCDVIIEDCIHLLNNKKSDIQLEKKLVAIIRFYQKICRATRMFEDIFSSMMIAEFVYSATFITNTFIVMELSGLDAGIVLLVCDVYLSMTFFVFCYLGEYNRQKHTEVLKALYGNNWYLLPTRLQKLQLILMSSIRDKPLFHYRVIPMLIVTFQKMAQITYSMFSVLQVAKNKENTMQLKT